MKINEIISPVRLHECRVRIWIDGVSVMFSTIINWEKRSDVISVMTKLYGADNVLWCNEISDLLIEKSYGGATSNKPPTPEQLQVKYLEKRASDKADSGDVVGSAEAKAQLAVQKAQIQKNKAQKNYTNKAHNLTMIRGS